MANWQQIAYFNLANLLESGVPVQRSVQVVAKGVRGSLSRGFRSAAGEIDKGSSLAEAMRKQARCFKPADIALIDAGETSGNLPNTLKQISEWHGFRRQINHKIINGLILPVLILHVAVFVPQLPAMILGNLSFNQYLINAALHLAYFIYIPATVVLFIMRFTPPTGIFRWALDGIVLRIPLLGKAIRHLSISTYCNYFAMLLRAGVPIAKTAMVAADVCGNRHIRALFIRGSQAAREGKDVSTGFAARLLPAGFIEAWQNGEATGNLDIVAQRLGNSSEEEARVKFSQFSRVFPAVIYVIISLYIISQIFKLFGSYINGIDSFLH